MDPDDQFYSAVLNLPRVRYVFLDPRTERRRYPLDFEYLGITVTATDFERLPELRPVFGQRLREFNLNSAEPIATVILAKNEDQIADLMRAHAEADFYTPAPWAEKDSGTHETGPSAGDRVFLLSRVVIQRP